MATLSARQRAALPDRAFAYIDSQGKRRLPIHDAGHVRNALSRFNQVAFEDDAARDRARIRLLNAAKKHGIMPIGFLSSQLNPQERLPTGNVTFLLADIESSTALLHRLGDSYAGVLADVRKVARKAVRGAGGHVASARGDDVVAVFEGAPGALSAAIAIQREMVTHEWPDSVECRLRIGLHSGRPQLTDSGYVGLSIHAAARICFAAHGGQIILSAAVRGGLPEDVSLKPLGAWRFRGLPEPIEMFQVQAPDLPSDFPPLRGATSS
jgi:class 3 adenylate cyclase